MFRFIIESFMVSREIPQRGSNFREKIKQKRKSGVNWKRIEIRSAINCSSELHDDYFPISLNNSNEIEALNLVDRLPLPFF